MCFQVKELAAPNLFQRLLGRKPRGNAAIELSNLLARSGCIRQVSFEAVRHIAGKYNLDLNGALRGEVEKLYRRYAGHCVSGAALTSEMTEDLEHLRAILQMREDRASEIFAEEAGARYAAIVRAAITGGCLNPSADAALEERRKNWGLPPDLTSRICETEAQSYLKSQLEAVIAGQSLSPEKERELNAAAASLGVPLSAEPRVQAALERCRLRWKIDHGELPEVSPGVPLPPREKCHFKGEADWYDWELTPSAFGPDQDADFTELGCLRRMASRLEGLREYRLVKMDSGHVLLTDKRIYFVGERETYGIHYSRMLSFQRNNREIATVRESGRDGPVIRLREEPELFTEILTRLTTR